MPIDMVLPLYLSNEDFAYRTPPCEPTLSSCLRFQPSHRADGDGDGDAEDRRPSPEDTRRAKKQVTFADHKGLSLTRVKIFSQFNDPIDVPLSVRETLSSAASPAAEEDGLALDFAQPSSDYLRFRQSLDRNCVCLERCVLKEKALAGTVKVKNVSFEKRVDLRVTFDTWRTHVDVPCAYVRDTYPVPYSDTFSFEVSLPEEPRPRDGVEFAVRYQAGGHEYWDSNHGDNYRVVPSSAKRSRRRADPFDLGIHFDPYGSPTCSHGVFPDWPSYAGYENMGPYY